MTRTIKFRVRTLDARLHYFTIYAVPDWISSDVPVDQFTGLVDKNGKEIYEGDILHIMNSLDYRQKNDGHDTNHVVKWHPEDASFKPYSYMPFDWGGFESLEVIGNIHENPELLIP